MSSMVRALLRLREDVLGRIRQVNTMTEQGVLKASSEMQKVVHIAREHIVELRNLVAGSGASGALRETIGQHSAHIRQHGKALDLAVTSHANEVAGLTALTREIKHAAAEIERANKAARLLSINARIESARSGADGFKAIAVEMYELSRVIVGANGRIQQLARQMEITLPRLIEQSKHLHTLVAEFTQASRTQIDAIDCDVRTLHASVQTSLERSDKALDGIISSSSNGLSALCFQDICSQSLLQIDHWNAATTRTLAAEVGEHVDLPELVEVVSTEKEILDKRAAGDVLLF